MIYNITTVKQTRGDVMIVKIENLEKIWHLIVLITFNRIKGRNFLLLGPNGRENHNTSCLLSLKYDKGILRFLIKNDAVFIYIKRISA